VFGGSGEGEGNYLSDVHVLHVPTMTWTSPEVKGDHAPAPRDSHGAVAVGGRLFVYGGDCGDRYHGEVDVLDVDTMSWSRVSVTSLSCMVVCLKCDSVIADRCTCFRSTDPSPLSFSFAFQT
jgi:Rab9 effector protein with kelch motifs